MRLYSICNPHTGAQPGYSPRRSVGNTPSGVVREPAVDNLPCSNEIIQAANDLFNRRYVIVHMHEEQIDSVGLQPFQTPSTD